MGGCAEAESPDIAQGWKRSSKRHWRKIGGLRYQHASDMRSDLQQLKRDTGSGRSSTASAATVVVLEAPAPRVGKLWKMAGPVLLLTPVVSGGGRFGRITV